MSSTYPHKRASFMTLRRDGLNHRIRHKGYEASISIGNDEHSTGYILDIREDIQIHGQTVPELRADFALKVEAYEARCASQGLAPFDTPDGRSTADLVDEEEAARRATVEEEASQWSPRDEEFLSSKAALMERHAQAVDEITYIRVPHDLRLPIDDVVDQLRGRKHPPQITVFRTNVANQHRLNAFARYRIAVAFRAANRSDSRNLDIRQADTLDFINDAQALQGVALDFINKYYSPGSMIPRVSKIEDRAAFESYMKSVRSSRENLNLFLSHLNEITGIAYEDLASIPPSRVGRPKQLWKYNFVAVISDLWFNLTGKRPSPKPSSFFIRFVEAAWLSGGDDMPEVFWEETVREYCHGARTRKRSNSEKEEDQDTL